MGSRFTRSVPVTINDVLDGHVALDLQCLDRLYLHGYLGQLQVGGQVIQFRKHRGLLAATLFAHESATFGVDVPAGLGGDPLLAAVVRLGRCRGCAAR